jgi:uncharacterized phage-associated protein
MATALDVAKFFLSRVDREKLVYYAQAWNLVLKNNPIFPEAVEAWINGPVVPELWTEYRVYEKNPIPFDEELNLSIFSDDELDTLNKVWETYGELSASKLWKLSHKEYPWVAARAAAESDERSKEEIPQINLHSFYSNFTEFLPNGVLNISRKALCEEKDFLISIEALDGNVQTVSYSELEDYLIENKGKLAKEKVNF